MSPGPCTPNEAGICLDLVRQAAGHEHRADVEIVAFLASALAYGRVEQIHRSLTDLLGRMGESPARFVAEWSNSSRRRLAGFKHRFPLCFFVIHGESDNANIWKFMMDKPGCLNAVHYRHIDIHKHNVRSRLADQVYGRFSVRSLTHN